VSGIAIESHPCPFNPWNILVEAFDLVLDPADGITGGRLRSFFE
jgi:hypothetical protein